MLNINAEAFGNNLDTMAHQVLKEYDIKPESLTLIQGGDIKTVWKLNAKGRQLCLKRLKQTIDKALFSVNAQTYIKNAGGKVPGVLLNNNDEPITEYNGQLFVLYEWITGEDLNFSIPSELKQAVQGLAAFHIASKGYLPSGQSRISTKLGKWPDQYASMRKKLSEWMDASLHNNSVSYYKAYLSCTGHVLTMADQAINALALSGYPSLVEEGSPSIVLCHQDFGKGNVLAAFDGMYVLDLDGVTFDLPSRDLRKIIGKNAENAGQWSAAAIQEILGWYVEINPMNNEEIKALYIDLLFPHWYYGLVKNLFQNKKPLKTAEIERIAKLETSKKPLLNTLLKGCE